MNLADSFRVASGLSFALDDEQVEVKEDVWSLVEGVVKKGLVTVTFNLIPLRIPLTVAVAQTSLRLRPIPQVALVHQNLKHVITIFFDAVLLVVFELEGIVVDRVNRLGDI